MKKLLAWILVIVLCVSNVKLSNVSADDKITANLSKVFIGKDGNEYKLNVSRKGDGDFEIEVVSDETEEKYIIDYSDGILTETEYEESFEFLGFKAYEETEENSIDITEYMDEVFASGYSSKIECIIPTLKGNHLRFWNGQSGKDVGYCKIACKATYRIKNNSEFVQAFKDKVNSSNRNVGKTGLTSAAAIAGAAALMGLITFMTEGVALLVLTTTVGCGGGAALSLYDAICDEMDAHQYFDQAKVNGKKI